jgi:hypothetical protein
MTDEQYHKICAACDQALNSNMTLVRVAVPMLHVIREHPVFLEKYEKFFNPKESQKNLLAPYSRANLSLKRVVTFIGSYLLYAKFLSRPCKNREERRKIIFVSHLVNDNHCGRVEDFYFGNIPNEIHESGMSAIIVLVNHTRKDGLALAKTWDNSKVERVVLDRALGLFDELKLYLKCRYEAFILVRQSKKVEDHLLRKVMLEASVDVLSAETRKNLRIGRQIYHLVRAYQPDMLMSTFEGHAWERVVFAEARSCKPEIICSGYQHSAIFKLQYAVRRPLGSRFDPDSIFTSGYISLGLFQKSPFGKLPIHVLGSSKSMENIELNGDGRDDTKLSCLVIPEGLESECTLLFDFALKCALRCTDVTFIWRTHPIMSFEFLRGKYKLFDALPENVTLSCDHLEADLKKSRWALYRGSTTIVQAVLAGVYPIYFNTSLFEIDPLFFMNDKSYFVSSVDEFNKLVMNMELVCNEAEIKHAASHFYTPVDIEVLKKQLVY